MMARGMIGERGRLPEDNRAVQMRPATRAVVGLPAFADDAGDRYGARREKAATGQAPAGRVYSRAMPVSRGLYVLRYLSAGDDAVPPRIVASFAPDSAADSRFYYGPDIQDGVMRRPGDAVIVSATDETVVVVTIFVEGMSRDDAVKLKLDRLDRPGEREPVGREFDERDAEASPVRAVRPAAAASGFSAETAEPATLPVFLSGHIAYRGDITVRAGHWLGERGGREGIEGFTVHWPRRPIGVDIGYSCEVAEVGVVPETLTGDFVGTRKRMLPVVAVSFQLRDERAGHYELELEAAFRDGSVVKASGHQVSARAREGASALVGLLLRVHEVRASRSNGVANGHEAGGLQSGRVKLYRGNASSRMPVED